MMFMTEQNYRAVMDYIREYECEHNEQKGREKIKFEDNLKRVQSGIPLRVVLGHKGYKYKRKSIRSKGGSVYDK